MFHCPYVHDTGGSPGRQDVTQKRERLPGRRLAPRVKVLWSFGLIVITFHFVFVLLWDFNRDQRFVSKLNMFELSGHGNFVESGTRDVHIVYLKGCAHAGRNALLGDRLRIFIDL